MNKLRTTCINFAAELVIEFAIVVADHFFSPSVTTMKLQSSPGLWNTCFLYDLQGPTGFEELRRLLKQGADFSKEVVSILQERWEKDAPLIACHCCFILTYCVIGPVIHWNHICWQKLCINKKEACPLCWLSVKIIATQVEPHIFLRLHDLSWALCCG